ncbi:unnamed protein product [Arctogadus glacialis]
MQSTASLERPLVFFDLETSEQRCSSEPGAGDIIQLAAISGGHTFNVYIMPQGDIDIVTKVRTGFSVKDDKLFQNSTAVSTVTLHEALTSFLAFLRSFNLPILLAAHNAKDIALHLLNKALIRCYLTKQFQELGPSFLDTLPLKTWRCEIIQLAAISGERTFNVYTMPEIAIDRGAAEATGFSVRDGALLLQGRAVPTVTLTEALTSFLDFLQSLEQPVLLAAHGARRFDKPVDRALIRCSLTRQFQQLGSRFLDTFLLSKALYQRIRSYSQVNLVRYFLGKNYNAHNALEDVRALQELYSWDPSQGSLNRWALSGNCSFNMYTMPEVPIESRATEVTGFSVQDGALFLNDRAVPTMTLHEALTSFLDFLRSLEQPVLLAAQAHTTANTLTHLYSPGHYSGVPFTATSSS